MNTRLTLAALFFGLTFISCKKENPNTTEDPISQDEIISNLATNVNYATYNDLSISSNNLYNAVTNFINNSTAVNLNECRDLWQTSRAAWEKSEGFLYGPVASENIDPRIDSWPVDFNSINVLLAGSTDFTVEANIDALDDALKGFHPIEFILWGENGEKLATDFTNREKEYLLALTANLKKLTSDLSDHWNNSLSNAYIHSFTSAGASNSFYTNKREVYEEIVNAMIGICEEVASGKIGEPFNLQDPTLEESPYSYNSLVDFKNNIRSVQNVYLGKYETDGYGLEDLVRQHKLTLDNTIKTKINTSISALSNITVPFGTAITDQPQQVQNAIDAIEDLKNTLEAELLPFVQQYVIN